MLAIIRFFRVLGLVGVGGRRWAVVRAGTGTGTGMGMGMGMVAGAVPVFVLLLVAACAAPTPTRTIDPRPAVEADPDGADSVQDDAPADAVDKLAPGGSGGTALEAASRETDPRIKACAAFRVNTEDDAGRLPDACRSLVPEADGLVSECRAQSSAEVCFTAGLLRLGNVPTTVAISLRLPRHDGFAQETVQLQETIAPAREKEGAALVDTACRAGHHGACELQALAKLPGFEGGFRRNVLANLCTDAASPGACTSWAYDVTGSRMKSEDDATVLGHVRDVLTSACRNGGSRSCANLAVVELMFDDDSPEAPGWAVEACTPGAGDPRLDGRGVACGNLVTMRLHRPAFKRISADWESAAAVLADTCDRGDQASCVHHAFATGAGLGVKKNRRASRSALAALCRQGARDACR